MRKTTIFVAAVLCTYMAERAGAAIITVTLNTSALVADAADQPFSLEFELDNGALISSNDPGGPFTNPSNIVTLTNFSFGGGFGFDPATDPAFLIDGGASGDIRSTVTLKANSQENYFSQGFMPGSQLRFTITYTNNVANANILDSFNFGILDSEYYEIPTYGGDIFDSFLQIDFDSYSPDVTTFASDPTLPTSAGEFLTIDAPVVGTPTAAPEPGTFWVLGSALLFLAFGKKLVIVARKVRSAAVPFAVLFLVACGSTFVARAADTPEYFTEVFEGRTITYQVINGYAVAEGDMVIGEAIIRSGADGRRRASLRSVMPNVIAHPASSTVNLPSKLWPKVNGVVTVPYLTTKGAPTMTAAINMFNSMFSGKFQWIPRTNQRAYVDINLNGQSSNSCYAALGYSGGKEPIEGVLNGCNVSAMLHEMGHIMGFAHEQSRANRNSYLFIDFSNIAPISQSQYTQDFANTMDLGLYDYGSLMHYGPRGFSRNGNPEMESMPAGIPFGDPPTFSVGDIDALNRIYFSAPSLITVTSLPAGLPIIVDGASYTAPHTFSWALSSTHTLNVPAGPQTIAGTNYLFGRWNSDLNADLNPSRTITITPGSGMFGSPASAPANTVYSVNYIQLNEFNPIPLLDNSTGASPTPGTVSTNPNPQAYPGLSGQYFLNRQLVTLTASPAAGNIFYDFESGGGQAFGPATNPLTLPSDQLTGNFYIGFSSMPEVLVTTNITNNNASGAVVVPDGGSSKALPGAFSQGYDAGWGPNTTHTLAVTSPVSPFNDANTRYTFGTWTDGLTTASRAVTVPASGVLALGVNYITSYHVTANSNSACAGSVSVTPVPPQDGFVVSGTALTFTASPIAPFVFAGWSGTLAGSGNPLSTSATGEVIGTANFNVTSTPLAITAVSPASLPAGSPGQTVTISGTGFTPSTTFYFNQFSRVATYVNPTTLTVFLAASDFAAAGTKSTIVQNSSSSCDVYIYGPNLVVTP